MADQHSEPPVYNYFELLESIRTLLQWILVLLLVIGFLLVAWLLGFDGFGPIVEPVIDN